MRSELLFFADSYTYLLYYYRLFIVTWIEDFSTIKVDIIESLICELRCFLRGSPLKLGFCFLVGLKVGYF